MNQFYETLNYIVIDAKKLRILRHKIQQSIVYNSFKHVDVKITNIYVSLTNFYIVIKNILRNIDQIKKIDQQKNANANRDIDFNKNQINNANNNQNDKKF